ncbi:MAG: TolC family protein [Acidobacteriota bacterium]|nr:MAG: TolC family protein [Acidobacteriota bacterium]
MSVVLFLPFEGWGQTVPAETLTLEQAIELALRENRQIRHEKFEYEKSLDKLATIETRRLPGFDISVLQLQWFNPLNFRFDRGVFGTFPGIGPVPGADTEVKSDRTPSAFIMATATQPLTQLHRIGLGIRLGEVTRDLANEKLSRQQREIVNQVKRSYYSILQLQSSLEASEETLKLYTELDRVVGTYVEQQVVLASESLDVKTQLAKEEYETLKVRNTLETAKEQLNHLLGRDIRTAFRVSPVSTATLYEADLSAAQARALTERPEIREARLRHKQAEYDYRIKKSEAIPDVSLTFGYYSAFGVSVLPRNAAGVGVTMNWEPFDWGRRRHEMSEKQKTIEQAREGMSEVEALVLREVGDRFRKLQESRALLRVSQLAQEAAQEKFRVATSKYEQEAVLYKDVLQSQAVLAEARNRYQQALLAFWTARADFEKAIGML